MLTTTVAAYKPKIQKQDHESRESSVRDESGDQDQSRFRAELRLWTELHVAVRHTRSSVVIKARQFGHIRRLSTNIILQARLLDIISGKI